MSDLGDGDLQYQERMHHIARESRSKDEGGRGRGEETLATHRCERSGTQKTRG